MAPKGRSKEVALQTELETREEWEEFTAKEGLVVVEIYQEWCGPCKSVVSSFKRIKNETGDELLKFAVAKADTIDHLEKYRGSCEPCFLFFASGSLVAVLRGVDGPRLIRVITEELAQEHKVLEGAAERKEIHDPKFSPTSRVDVEAGSDEVEEESSSDEDDDDDMDIEKETPEGDMLVGGEIINFSEVPEGKLRRRRGVHLTKSFAVAVILPDVAADERLPDIIAKIEAAGLDIIKQEQRNLTETEVREIYASETQKEIFESFTEFLTGDPSVILCLSKGKFGDNVVEDLTSLVGPPTVNLAQGGAPESLRAVYGKAENFLSPAFYTSMNKQAAERDVKLFFPEKVGERVELRYPVPEKKPKLLGIMTATSFKQHGSDGFLTKVTGANFKILHQKVVEISKARAEQFYKKMKENPQYPALVNSISSDKVFVVAVTKEGSTDAGLDWNHLIGPKTLDEINETPHCLKAQFMVRGDPLPAIHCSEDLNSGQREVGFFFPMQEVLITVKPHAHHRTDEILHRIRREDFIIVDVKEIHLTNPMVADLYRNVVDKPFFNELCEQMTSGPTTFIVALKVDGIQDIRRLVGKCDPEEALQDDPNSLRAVFGTSIIENAIHVPSDLQCSKADIAKVFGAIDFDHDGVILKRRRPKQQLGQIEDHPTALPPKDQPDRDTTLTGLTPEQCDVSQACPLKELIDQEQAEAGGESKETTGDGAPAIQTAAGTKDHPKTVEAGDERAPSEAGETAIQAGEGHPTEETHEQSAKGEKTDDQSEQHGEQGQGERSEQPDGAVEDKEASVAEGEVPADQTEVAQAEGKSSQAGSQTSVVDDVAEGQEAAAPAALAAGGEAVGDSRETAESIAGSSAVPDVSLNGAAEGAAAEAAAEVGTAATTVEPANTEAPAAEAAATEVPAGEAPAVKAPAVEAPAAEAPAAEAPAANSGAEAPADTSA